MTLDTLLITAINVIIFLENHSTGVEGAEGKLGTKHRLTSCKLLAQLPGGICMTFLQETSNYLYVNALLEEKNNLSLIIVRPPVTRRGFLA